MNKTKIEWCDSTWNPVTGCLHGCPYCYAKRVVQRFGTDELEDMRKLFTLDSAVHKGDFATVNPYPFGFAPTFHKHRLEEPQKKTKGQTIFVCSMADLFGKWVPTEWIVKVLDACLEAPQHRYLFLTKNPQRYIELDELALLPRKDNFWYGSTVTDGEAPTFFSSNHNTFMSIEPILGKFIDGVDEMPVDWVILGAETGHREGKVVPEYDWVEPVVTTALVNGVPVFMKDSMKAVYGENLITEFPWDKKF